jgi:hypothetical protein
MALARPARWTVSTRDSGAATLIELPRRSLFVAALVVTTMFAVLAGVEAIVIRGLHFDTRSVADLAMSLFMLAWIAGWSVGVLMLGALTVLLWLPSFFREAVYVRDTQLVTETRLGPLRMRAGYDLAGIRNMRIEDKPEGATLSFDYGDGARTLGEGMPRELAERIVASLALPATPAPAPVASPATPVELPAREAAPLTPASTLALIGANLIPLAGVLLWGWQLGDVMVLFWAESAVVGFYALAKMAVVGRWLAIPAGVFFVAHFGAFMVMHFLFIYEIFVRGLAPKGHEPAAYEALTGVFVPLWPALAALFLSHGVSFVIDFLGRGERRATTLAKLTSAPYGRIVLMQLTVIFGGWLAFLLHDARPALALLVALKIGADLYAHRRERAGALSAPRRTATAGRG